MKIDQNKLKKLKYRANTLGIRELDLIVNSILKQIVIDDDAEKLVCLEELMLKNSQYIYDFFFNNLVDQKFEPLRKYIKN